MARGLKDCQKKTLIFVCCRVSLMQFQVSIFQLFHHISHNFHSGLFDGLQDMSALRSLRHAEIAEWAIDEGELLPVCCCGSRNKHFVLCYEEYYLISCCLKLCALLFVLSHLWALSQKSSTVRILENYSSAPSGWVSWDNFSSFLRFLLWAGWKLRNLLIMEFIFLFSSGDSCVIWGKIMQKI